MTEKFTRADALNLLTKYNQEAFHRRHALTVEQVMRYLATRENEDPDFWGLVGLLHDVDYEQFPEQHCEKAPELLEEIGASEEFIHAVCSHGYGLRVDIEPTAKMEKILYATDELTGLIWAAAQMRPSRSTLDMDLKSVKKKFKNKKFAAGCSREVIAKGAEMLGWTVDELLAQTLAAMQASEETVEREYRELTKTSP